jgi:DNA primase
MADPDKAGRAMVKELGKALGERVPVFDAKLPDGLDPGEAVEAQIVEAVNGARLFGLTSVG